MDYKIIRSDRKTVAIVVSADGTVTVRAPKKATDAYIRSIVEQKKDWIEKHQKTALSKPKPPELTKQQIELLVAKAKEILPPKVAYYSQIMGVTPTAITVTGAKTRFGSCSGKNRICFSYILMQYPEEAIDYVVVHELAHIKHKNHSKSFYAYVQRFLPDYKKREQILKTFL